MTLDDLQHDLKMAAIFGLLILGLLILVVGIQRGIRRGKSLAERPGVREQTALAEESPRVPTGAVTPVGDPIWQQSAESALLRDQMLLSCDPVEVAAEINRADAYREAAVGVNAGGSVSQRQLYALGAVASELWLSRCLRWFGAR
mgnify:CR=1 FL=1